jgi:hypothetical protein
VPDIDGPDPNQRFLRHVAHPLAIYSGEQRY